MNKNSSEYSTNYVIHTIIKRIFFFLPGKICIDMPELDLNLLTSSEEISYFASTYYKNVFRDSWGLEKINGIARRRTGQVWDPHPLAPSLYALRLCCWNNRSVDLQLIRRHLLILTEISSPEGLICYDPVCPDWRVKPPMPSGLSQGFALSLAIRIYRLSQQESDHIIARNLIKGMLLSIEEGGPLRNTQSGPILEEYAGSDRYPGVLNGWLTALISIIEYVETFPNEFQEEVTNCYNSFCAHLPFYVKKYGVKYSLGSSRLSGGEYPMLVCFQLMHLSQITNLPEWRTLALDWSKYVDWAHAERTFDSQGAKVKLYESFNA